jgi:hypothetical protein
MDWAQEKTERNKRNMVRPLFNKKTIKKYLTGFA